MDFADAIKQRMLAASHPDAALTRQAMTQFVAQQDEDLRQVYLASYQRIGALLAEAKANQADGTTIATLKQMQDGYAKRIAG